MKVRDSPLMRALWTGIHPVWVHYEPGPTLATINLQRGVSFTTYHPPRNHWGDTSDNQMVQPLSGKEADGTLALYRPEVPRSQAAQRCNPAYILRRLHPCSPNDCRLEPVTPQIVHNKEPKSYQLNPERESGHVLVFP